jgi:15-cis-phytoene synthase
LAVIGIRPPAFGIRKPVPGNRTPDTAPVRAAIEHCETVIQEGSKSFALAARLFDRETMRAAFSLYGWCRHCDDQIDLLTGDLGGAEERLRRLRKQTEDVFAGRPQNDPVFIALQYVTTKYGIPSHYPLELLEGMAMDVRSQRYETIEELLLYCYRVAGTVGLMMAHVMGISDEKALRHAAAMGIGMQLTNIARDIIEDAERGRVYMPLSWLAEADLPVEDIVLPEHRGELAGLTRRLLAVADGYYSLGRAGIRYLPFRCGCAVAAAHNVYAEIGQIALQRGRHAWDDRAYTSKARKLVLAARGVAQVAGSIPQRILHPWSAVPINTIRRFSPMEKVSEI